MGLVQLPFTASFDDHRKQAEQLVAEAVAAGAALVALAESPLRPWCAAAPGTPGRLDPPPGAVAAWASALAQQHGCYLHCVDLERHGDRWQNTARLHAPDSTSTAYYKTTAYYKRHLPDVPGLRETA